MKDIRALAEKTFGHLSGLVAIDSQSDEASSTIPSTPGQRVLAEHLRRYFDGLGLKTELDDFANLIVSVPASAGAERTPACALLTHLDTSEGTLAVPKLNTIQNWQGTKVPYPENPDLTVGAEHYAELQEFVGQTLVFGPGRYPFGLDNKLGVSYLMSLAEILVCEDVRHGPVLLVFRPDEEIGRMAAVEGLAAELEKRGVRYGYTVDGLFPFEVNTENFNASMGKIRFPGEQLPFAAAPIFQATVQLTGVTTHGAVAKTEGHLNSLLVFARVADRFFNRSHEIAPVKYESDVRRESDGSAVFYLGGAKAEALCRELEAAFTEELQPHHWKGARARINFENVASTPLNFNDAALSISRVIINFLKLPGPLPRLSEDSCGFEGYSNPYAVYLDEGVAVLHFRLRDFDADGLKAREQQLQTLVKGTAWEKELLVKSQYVNMGLTMKKYPHLVQWAQDAAVACGVKSEILPIRGGTGVDPFIARNIPIANLGVGYFAAESEKELTSTEMMARHVVWIQCLLERIARGS